MDLELEFWNLDLGTYDQNVTIYAIQSITHLCLTNDKIRPSCRIFVYLHLYIIPAIYEKV